MSPCTLPRNVSMFFDGSTYHQGTYNTTLKGGRRLLSVTWLNLRTKTGKPAKSNTGQVYLLESTQGRLLYSERDAAIANFNRWAPFSRYLKKRNVKSVELGYAD